MPQSKHKVAVIGGGPAGLMAAETLARGGCAVTIYERMANPGRKFLLAGRGGLNLTHGEPLATFLARYGDIDARLRTCIEAFPPTALRSRRSSVRTTCGCPCCGLGSAASRCKVSPLSGDNAGLAGTPLAR